MDEIVILGGGGLASEVADAVRALETDGGLVCRALYDDDRRLKGRMLQGLEYAGTIQDYLDGDRPGAACVIGIGDNAVRERLAAELAAAGRTVRAVLHPTAVVSGTATVGPGCYIAAWAFVGPRVRLGRHVVVNVGTSIGHDAVVEDLVQLCPGVRVSGFCHIGRAAFLGSNAVVAPGKRVGAGARLSACSFAGRDIPSGTLASGVPARCIG